MRKAIISILMIATIALPLAAEDITPTISVSGTAEVSVMPDTAYFSISASYVADTSEEARKLASGTISDAVGILTSEYGIRKEDIATEVLTIYPEYRWEDGEQIPVGQRATQGLRITLRDLAAIGDIYDSLSAFDGLEFSTRRTRAQSSWRQGRRPCSMQGQRPRHMRQQPESGSGKCSLFPKPPPMPPPTGYRT